MKFNRKNNREGVEVPISEPIGREQVRAAMQTLTKYKSGKSNLEQRIIENEQFWKMRHWEQMRKRGREGNPLDVQPASGWLVNCVLNRHADAIDNYPEPNCLPRAQDDVEEAKRLSKVLPVILKQNGFEKTYSDAWWYKLKSGTGVYGVFWDGGKLGGLGDISVKRMDILNLFWEPGITDIQDSENFFSVELADNSRLLAEWPEKLEGRLKGGQDVTVAKYIYDDAVDTSDKSLVVDWYYHRGGRLQYCKFVQDVVLYATENDPEIAAQGWYDHGKYPFVFDTLFPEEGTPCGFGYIDICKDPQMQIDLLNQAILKNAMAGATPRYFIRSDGAVNEEEYADWTKPFVHTNGNLGADSIAPITVTPLNGIYVSVLQGKVDELRETSGNTESYSGAGGSGVTAASAIAALQEASGKLSRDMIEASYRSYEEICLLCIDLIRQFYDLPRQFRITGEMGVEEFVGYTNAGLRPVEQRDAMGQPAGYRTPVIDIDVQPQSESRYTKREYNELALQFYQMGLFNPQMADQALAAMGMMEFKGKDALMQKISQNGGLYQQVLAMKQQMLKMAEILDAQNGSNIAEKMAAEDMNRAGVEAAPAAEAEQKSEKGESAVTEKAREQTRSVTRPV